MFVSAGDLTGDEFTSFMQVSLVLLPDPIV